ncbi:MAG: hypothetical protein Kow0020_06200 [Wenzhouxiangellaceae bacterium]
MAIIRCPACDRRISSKAPSCPHCHEAVGELNDEQRERLAMRRWRDQMYRVRNLTYLAMVLIVAGLGLWWVTGAEGLVLPINLGALILLMLGTMLYLVGWALLMWIRWRKDPRRTD